MLVQVSDEIRINKHGDIFVNGKALTAQEVKALADQVEWFRKSDLYRILYQDLLEKAKKRIFIETKTTDDLTWGKAMLYNKSVEEEIMNLIERHKPPSDRIS